MGKSKQDQQKIVNQRLANQRVAEQKKIPTNHERKFNSSSVDTQEEIDALSRSGGPVDTPLEREYHGLNKLSMQAAKKKKLDSSEDPEPDHSSSPRP